MISLSDIELLKMIYQKSAGDLIVLSDEDLLTLINKTETALSWLYNIRALKPVLAAASQMKEAA